MFVYLTAIGTHDGSKWLIKMHELGLLHLHFEILTLVKQTPQILKYVNIFPPNDCFLKRRRLEQKLRQ